MRPLHETVMKTTRKHTYNLPIISVFRRKLNSGREPGRLFTSASAGINLNLNLTHNADYWHVRVRVRVRVHRDGSCSH